VIDLWSRFTACPELLNGVELAEGFHASQAAALTFFPRKIFSS
jgi:hypothetical protein